MLIFLKSFLVAVIVFFVIDMIWLGFIARKFYQNQIGELLKPNVNWAAAIIFYLLFVSALVFFVIQPALEKDAVLYALLVGAFFGFITYATYDLTNLATLKDWPLLVTVVDLAWGTFLGASTSVISFYLIRLLF